MKNSLIVFYWSLSGFRALGLPREPHLHSGFLSQYTESNITWTGQVTEDGPIAQFTGLSLQHIEAQIREAFPSFSGWAPPSGSGSPEHAGRAKGSTDCEPPGAQFASSYWIVHAIDYLRGVTGNCTNGPGPGNCGRLSCSWNSGIWWCNDNPEPYTVDCGVFASYVIDIIQTCYNQGATPDLCVMGQEFDSDRWSVIVAGTKDWC